MQPVPSATAIAAHAAAACSVTPYARPTVGRKKGVAMRKDAKTVSRRGTAASRPVASPRMGFAQTYEAPSAVCEGRLTTGLAEAAATRQT